MPYPCPFASRPFSPREFMSALEQTAKETDPTFSCSIAPFFGTLVGDLHWTNQPEALYQVYFFDSDNAIAGANALDQKKRWSVQLSSSQNTGIPRRMLSNNMIGIFCKTWDPNFPQKDLETIFYQFLDLYMAEEYGEHRMKFPERNLLCWISYHYISETADSFFAMESISFFPSCQEDSLLCESSVII